MSGQPSCLCLTPLTQKQIYYYPNKANPSLLFCLSEVRKDGQKINSALFISAKVHQDNLDLAVGHSLNVGANMQFTSLPYLIFIESDIIQEGNVEIDCAVIYKKSPLLHEMLPQSDFKVLHTASTLVNSQSSLVKTNTSSLSSEVGQFIVSSPAVSALSSSSSLMRVLNESSRSLFTGVQATGVPLHPGKPCLYLGSLNDPGKMVVMEAPVTSSYFATKDSTGKLHTFESFNNDVQEVCYSTATNGQTPSPSDYTCHGLPKVVNGTNGSDGQNGQNGLALIPLYSKLSTNVIPFSSTQAVSLSVPISDYNSADYEVFMKLVSIDLEGKTLTEFKLANETNTNYLIGLWNSMQSGQPIKISGMVGREGKDGKDGSDGSDGANGNIVLTRTISQVSATGGVTVKHQVAFVSISYYESNVLPHLNQPNFLSSLVLTPPFQWLTQTEYFVAPGKDGQNGLAQWHVYYGGFDDDEPQSSGDDSISYNEVKSKYSFGSMTADSFRYVASFPAPATALDSNNMITKDSETFSVFQEKFPSLTWKVNIHAPPSAGKDGLPGSAGKDASVLTICRKTYDSSSDDSASQYSFQLLGEDQSADEYFVHVPKAIHDLIDDPAFPAQWTGRMTSEVGEVTPDAISSTDAKAAIVANTFVLRIVSKIKPGKDGASGDTGPAGKDANHSHSITLYTSSLPVTEVRQAESLAGTNHQGYHATVNNLATAQYNALKQISDPTALCNYIFGSPDDADDAPLKYIDPVTQKETNVDLSDLIVWVSGATGPTGEQGASGAAGADGKHGWTGFYLWADPGIGSEVATFKWQGNDTTTKFRPSQFPGFDFCVVIYVPSSNISDLVLAIESAEVDPTKNVTLFEQIKSGDFVDSTYLSEYKEFNIRLLRLADSDDIENDVFTLNRHKGDKGETGQTGLQGPQGTAGPSYQVIPIYGINDTEPAANSYKDMYLSTNKPIKWVSWITLSRDQAIAFKTASKPEEYPLQSASSGDDALDFANFVTPGGIIDISGSMPFVWSRIGGADGAPGKDATPSDTIMVFHTPLPPAKLQVEVELSKFDLPEPPTIEGTQIASATQLSQLSSTEASKYIYTNLVAIPHDQTTVTLQLSGWVKSDTVDGTSVWLLFGPNNGLSNVQGEGFPHLVSILKDLQVGGTKISELSSGEQLNPSKSEVQAIVSYFNSNKITLATRKAASSNSAAKGTFVYHLPITIDGQLLQTIKQQDHSQHPDTSDLEAGTLAAYLKTAISVVDTYSAFLNNSESPSQATLSSSITPPFTKYIGDNGVDGSSTFVVYSNVEKPTIEDPDHEDANTSSSRIAFHRGIGSTFKFKYDFFLSSSDNDTLVSAATNTSGPSTFPLFKDLYQALTAETRLYGEEDEFNNSSFSNVNVYKYFIALLTDLSPGKTPPIFTNTEGVNGLTTDTIEFTFHAETSALIYATSSKFTYKKLYEASVVNKGTLPHFGTSEVETYEVSAQLISGEQSQAGTWAYLDTSYYAGASYDADKGSGKRVVSSALVYKSDTTTEAVFKEGVNGFEASSTQQVIDKTMTVSKFKTIYTNALNTTNIDAKIVNLSVRLYTSNENAETSFTGDFKYTCVRYDIHDHDDSNAEQISTDWADDIKTYKYYVDLNMLTLAGALGSSIATSLDWNDTPLSFLTNLSSTLETTAAATKLTSYFNQRIGTVNWIKYDSLTTIPLFIGAESFSQYNITPGTVAKKASQVTYDPSKVSSNVPEGGTIYQAQVTFHQYGTGMNLNDNASFREAYEKAVFNAQQQFYYYVESLPITQIAQVKEGRATKSSGQLEALLYWDPGTLQSRTFSSAELTALNKLFHKPNPDAPNTIRFVYCSTSGNTKPGDDSQFFTSPFASTKFYVPLTVAGEPYISATTPTSLEDFILPMNDYSDTGLEKYKDSLEGLLNNNGETAWILMPQDGSKGVPGTSGAGSQPIFYIDTEEQFNNHLLIPGASLAAISLEVDDFMVQLSILPDSDEKSVYLAQIVTTPAGEAFISEIQNMNRNHDDRVIVSGDALALISESSWIRMIAQGQTAKSAALDSQISSHQAELDNISGSISALERELTLKNVELLATQVSLSGKIEVLNNGFVAIGSNIFQMSSNILDLTNTTNGQELSLTESFRRMSEHELQLGTQASTITLHDELIRNLSLGADNTETFTTQLSIALASNGVSVVALQESVANVYSSQDVLIAQTTELSQLVRDASGNLDSLQTTVTQSLVGQSTMIDTINEALFSPSGHVLASISETVDITLSHGKAIVSLSETLNGNIADVQLLQKFQDDTLIPDLAATSTAVSALSALVDDINLALNSASGFSQLHDAHIAGIAEADAKIVAVDETVSGVQSSLLNIESMIEQLSTGELTITAEKLESGIGATSWGALMDQEENTVMTITSTGILTASSGARIIEYLDGVYASKHVLEEITFTTNSTIKLGVSLSLLTASNFQFMNLLTDANNQLAANSQLITSLSGQIEITNNSNTVLFDQTFTTISSLITAVSAAEIAANKSFTPVSLFLDSLEVGTSIGDGSGLNLIVNDTRFDLVEYNVNNDGEDASGGILTSTGILTYNTTTNKLELGTVNADTINVNQLLVNGTQITGDSNSSGSNQQIDLNALTSLGVATNDGIKNVVLSIRNGGAVFEGYSGGGSDDSQALANRIRFDPRLDIAATSIKAAHLEVGAIQDLETFVQAVSGRAGVIPTSLSLISLSTDELTAGNQAKILIDSTTLIIEHGGAGSDDQLHGQGLILHNEGLSISAGHITTNEIKVKGEDLYERISVLSAFAHNINAQNNDSNSTNSANLTTISNEISNLSGRVTSFSDEVDTILDNTNSISNRISWLDQTNFVAENISASKITVGKESVLNIDETTIIIGIGSSDSDDLLHTDGIALNNTGLSISATNINVNNFRVQGRDVLSTLDNLSVYVDGLQSNHSSSNESNLTAIDTLSTNLNSLSAKFVDLSTMVEENNTLATNISNNLNTLSSDFVDFSTRVEENKTLVTNLSNNLSWISQSNLIVEDVNASSVTTLDLFVSGLDVGESLSHLSTKTGSNLQALLSLTEIVNTLEGNSNNSSDSITFGALQTALETAEAEAGSLRIPRLESTNVIDGTTKKSHGIEMTGASQIVPLKYQIPPQTASDPFPAWELVPFPEVPLNGDFGNHLYYEVAALTKNSLSNNPAILSWSPTYTQLPVSDGFLGFNMRGYWEFLSNALQMTTQDGGILIKSLHTNSQNTGQLGVLGGVEAGSINLEAQTKVVIKVGDGNAYTGAGQSVGPNPAQLELTQQALTSLNLMITKFNGTGFDP